MLRKAYSPILTIKEQENGIEPNIKPNDWVVGTVSPAPKVEVYDNFYFQFPADEELGGLIMECCGNCKHHILMSQDTFMCDNEDSEGYGLETQYDDYCEEFEERED